MRKASIRMVILRFETVNFLVRLREILMGLTYLKGTEAETGHWASLRGNIRTRKYAVESI